MAEAAIRCPYCGDTVYSCCDSLSSVYYRHDWGSCLRRKKMRESEDIQEVGGVKCRDIPNSHKKS